MSTEHRNLSTWLGLLVVWLVLSTTQSARAYIDIIPTLGRLLTDTKAVVVLQVDKVDREKKIVLYRIVETLSNSGHLEFPEKVRHLVGGGLHPLESKQLLDWAKPGKTAVALISGPVAIVCIGPEWYEVHQDDPNTWTMTRGRSELTFAYLGTAEKFRDALREILAEKEVTITAVRWGAGDLPAEAIAYKQALRGRDLPLWRIRASLKMPPFVGDVVELPRWIVGPGYGDAVDVPPLIKDLHSENVAQRAAAAETLGLIGRPARGALADLLALQHDAEELVAARAVAAALRIDPHQTEALKRLKELLKSPNAEVRRAAVLAASDLGRKAQTLAEQLVAAADDPDAEVRWSAVEALGQCRDLPEVVTPALLKALSKPELQTPAMEALAMLGSAGAAAAPELTKLLESADPAQQWAAAITLLRCDKDSAQKSIPLLLKALASDNGRTRWDVIWYFEQLPEPQVALPELTKLLAHENPEIRDSTLMVLGNIGENAAATVPEIVKALDDRSPGVRNAAARALSLMRVPDGPAAERAAQVLGELFSRTDPRPEDWILWDTADYLRHLGTPEKIAVPLYCRLATHENASVRRAALTALYELGDFPDTVKPVVLERLHDPDPAVKFAAIKAATILDDVENQLTQPLSEVLQQGEAKLREEALRLLKKSQLTADQKKQLLHARLKDESARVRVTAADLLFSLEPKVEQVLPIFVAALNDADPEVRELAVEGIGDLGPVAKSAGDKLKAALHDRSVRVQISAAASLHRLRLDTDEAVTVLSEALYDADDKVRQSACEVLGKFTTSARPYLPHLSELLTEDNVELRFAVAAAILRISEHHADAAALKVAIDSLSVGDLDFRIGVAEFLGELGTAAKVAAPALRSLQDDPKEKLAGAAAQALKKVTRPNAPDADVQNVDPDQAEKMLSEARRNPTGDPLATKHLVTNHLLTQWLWPGLIGLFVLIVGGAMWFLFRKRPI